MTTLVDIRKAKAIGKSIADLRQTKNVSLRSLAMITGLTIQQIVHLESGNCFAFNQSHELFLKLANQCLEILDSGKKNINSQRAESETIKLDSAQTIPAYLRRVS